ncbi:MAG: hypothetical protein ACYDA9_03075 [Terriglobia bacterium]
MKKIRLLALVGFFLAGSQAFAATYYIDFTNGSDLSLGITKALPWQHAPGMQGCTGLCLVKQTVGVLPGDNIILKGGVTWPNAALGWNFIWSGTSSATNPGCSGPGCIYIGVDQTWFSGASWTRPILNAGGSTVAATAGGPANVLLRLYCNYVIVDNLEFSGVFWSGVPTFGTGTNIALAGGTLGKGVNVELKNLYIHGWSHGTSASGTSENPCGIVGDTSVPNNNVNTILHDSVIDGSDTDQASCSAIFGSPPIVQHNFIQYVSSALIVNGTVLVDGNTILHVVHSFDSNAHENGIEVNVAQDLMISNNLIAHLGTGALGIWCAPDATFSCEIFNNVMYDTDTGNVLDLAAPLINNGCANNGTYCNVGGTDLVYNNTMECGPDSNPNAVCAAGISSSVVAVALENNHFISSAGSYWNTNGVTPTLITNLQQSLATANGQGYSSAEFDPFSPTASGNSTVGAGTNLTSSCTGSASTLCSDTPIGVAYNSTTHTVSVPFRTTNSRPASGAWDIGAYEFASAPPPIKPNPPISITAVPH